MIGLTLFAGVLRRFVIEREIIVTLVANLQGYFERRGIDDISLIHLYGLATNWSFYFGLRGVIIARAQERIGSKSHVLVR
jgi:hypothetical protein